MSQGCKMRLTMFPTLFALKHAETGTMQRRMGLPTLAGIWLLCAFVFSISGQARGGGMSFQISSTAFSEGGMIPKKFTCARAGCISPAKLEGCARSHAKLRPHHGRSRRARRHVGALGVVQPACQYERTAGRSGKTGTACRRRAARTQRFRKVGYGGPCPPTGNTHRYYFKLYALDAKVDLKAGVTKADAERAMKGHILGQTQLMGRYGR